MPDEPPPTRWLLPPADTADENGLVGVGADLEPGTLYAAYRAGLFPMPLGVDGPMGWWSPNPRGVLSVATLHVSRSLRKSCRRFEIRVDTAFEAVIDGCRQLDRPGAWITREVRDAYVELHRRGWAHSVEAWDRDGNLAGGLYGVAIGGLFAGESMFHHRRDASKVALARLIELMHERERPLLDVQWLTPHLESLGAVEVSRREYLEMLERATG